MEKTMRHIMKGTNISGRGSKRKKKRKKKMGTLPMIMGSVRPFRTFHFCLMVIMGVIIRQFIGLDGNGLLEMDTFSPSRLLLILLAFGAVASVWQFTTMTNDIYDVEIDKRSHKGRTLASGYISVEKYRKIAISFALASIFFSLFLGYVPVILMVSFIGLGIAYSVPPLRIRNRIFATTIIGAGSFIAYTLGYFSPSLGILDYSGIGLDTSSFVFMNTEALLIGALIFILLSISPFINAYKDYDGDKAAGVKNPLTLLEKAKAKRFVTALIPVLFLSPLLLINFSIDLLIIVPAAAIATVVFYKLENIKMIFGIYFIILIYGLLRISEFIQYS